MPSARHGIALALAIFMVGCASTGPAITPPEVRLESIDLDKVHLPGQIFLLGLSISNPNPFDLPVSRIGYAIRLDGHRFASGETRSGFVVAAGDVGHVKLKVEVDLLRQVSGLTLLFDSGAERSLRYEFEGSLGIDVPGALPATFRKSGIITIRQ